MSNSGSVPTTYGKWAFIVPISGLVLTKAVQYEYTIGRVTFVDKNKLPRIRRRFRLQETLSATKERFAPILEVVDSASTYAVLLHTGAPKEIATTCLRIVNEALSLLSVSQLGYARRRFGCHPVILGKPTIGTQRYAYINLHDARIGTQHSVVGKLRDLTLDEKWKQFQRQTFFTKLHKIIEGKLHVDNGWRQDLRAAAIMVGRSLTSDDIPTSFLWNVIALERLLTVQGDAYLQALPSRLEAFLGWTGFWATQDYETRIRDVYRKRSQLVHEGNDSNISVPDVLFTDDLLLNLLINLVNHIKIFPNKQAVMDFATKVQAEKLLGIKPRVRPEGLRFRLRDYSDYDLAAI
jgi:hypothetical protein